MRDPAAPPALLFGHNGEVTSVAWCPADPCQLATASDDATVRVWTLGDGWRAAADGHRAAAAASAREERRGAERAAAAAAAGGSGAGSARAAAGAAAAASEGRQAAARASRAAARDLMRSGSRRSGDARGLGSSAAGGTPLGTSPGTGTPGTSRPSSRLRQALITDRLPQLVLVPSTAGRMEREPPMGPAAAAVAAAAAVDMDVDERGASVVDDGARQLAAAPSHGTPPRRWLAQFGGRAATPVAWGTWSSGQQDSPQQQQPRPQQPPQTRHQQQPQQQQDQRHQQPRGTDAGPSGPGPGANSALAGGGQLPSGQPLISCPRHPFGCRCYSNGDSFAVYEDAPSSAAGPSAAPAGPSGGQAASGGVGRMCRTLSFDTSLIEPSAPQQDDEEQEQQQQQQQQQPAADESQRRRGRQEESAGSGGLAAAPGHRALRRSCLCLASSFGFPEVTRSGSPSRDSWPAISNGQQQQGRQLPLTEDHQPHPAHRFRQQRDQPRLSGLSNGPSADENAPVAGMPGRRPTLAMAAAAGVRGAAAARAAAVAAAVDSEQRPALASLPVPGEPSEGDLPPPGCRGDGRQRAAQSGGDGGGEAPPGFAFFGHHHQQQDQQQDHQQLAQQQLGGLLLHLDSQEQPDQGPPHPGSQPGLSRHQKRQASDRQQPPGAGGASGSGVVQPAGAQDPNPGGAYVEPSGRKRQRKLSDLWVGGAGGLEDQSSRFEPFD